MSRAMKQHDVPHFDPSGPIHDLRYGRTVAVDEDKFLALIQCSRRALKKVDEIGNYPFTAGSLAEALDPFQDYFAAAEGTEGAPHAARESEDVAIPDETLYGEAVFLQDDDALGGRIVKEASRALHLILIGLVLGAMAVAAGLALMNSPDFPDANSKEVSDATDR